jgi:predicted amidohydrolase YtcJ
VYFGKLDATHAGGNEGEAIDLSGVVVAPGLVIAVARMRR